MEIGEFTFMVRPSATNLIGIATHRKTAPASLLSVKSLFNLVFKL